MERALRMGGKVTVIQGTGEPLGDREVKEGEAEDLAVFHTKGSRSTKTQACQAEKLSCLGGLEAGCWRSPVSRYLRGPAPACSWSSAANQEGCALAQSWDSEERAERV